MRLYLLLLLLAIPLASAALNDATYIVAVASDAPVDDVIDATDFAVYMQSQSNVLFRSALDKEVASTLGVEGLEDKVYVISSASQSKAIIIVGSDISAKDETVVKDVKRYFEMKNRKVEVANTAEYDESRMKELLLLSAWSTKKTETPKKETVTQKPKEEPKKDEPVEVPKKIEEKKPVVEPTPVVDEKKESVIAPSAESEKEVPKIEKTDGFFSSIGRWFKELFS